MSDDDDARAASRVMPREPTRAMIDAAAKAMSPAFRPDDWVSVARKHAIRYAAMFDAAPHIPPAGWVRLSKKTRPTPGRSYLVAANYGGLRTFDVAFYNGAAPDGSHWWLLGGSDIPAKAIEFWREIDSPWDEAETP